MNYPPDPPPEAPITVVPPLRPPVPAADAPWHPPVDRPAPGQPHIPGQRSGQPAPFQPGPGGRPWPVQQVLPGYPPVPPGYPAAPAGYPGPAGYPVPVGYRPVPAARVVLRPTAPNGAPLASFGERLGAYLLDRLIIGGIASIPMAILALVLLLPPALDAARVASETGTPVHLGGWFFVRYLVVIACSVLVQALVGYYLEVTWQVRTGGQTVGKKVLGVRTVLLDGAPLTHPAARLRYGVQFASTLVPGLVYLDGLWQLWDKPLRQCLHDKAARTVVIKL